MCPRFLSVRKGWLGRTISPSHTEIGWLGLPDPEQAAATEQAEATLSAAATARGQFPGGAHTRTMHRQQGAEHTLALWMVNQCTRRDRSVSAYG